MNLHAILNTHLKWFMLVNTISTIAFLPLLSHFVSAQDRAGVVLTAAGYGAVWFGSGLASGILDGTSERGHHREMAYASFMFMVASYLLVAGRLFWPDVVPLSWTGVTLVTGVCVAGIVVIQLLTARHHGSYTKGELFE